MAKAELIADPDYVAADISTENCHHAEGASVFATGRLCDRNLASASKRQHPLTTTGDL